MASEFQSSFIPKDPMTPEVFKKKKAGVLGILVVSLFVSIVIVSIGLYAYKNILKNDIANLQSQLATAGGNTDDPKIKEMIQFSKKLDIVKSIVFKHQVISGFLSSLASSTVSTVSFNDFSYNNLANDKLSVTLRGKTNSYGSVALQESVFAKNKYWKSVSFSNLSLVEKGKVAFEVTVSVDPQIAIYAPKMTTASTTSSNSVSDIASELDNLDSLNLDINGL